MTYVETECRQLIFVHETPDANPSHQLPKAHASEIVRELAHQGPSMVITQNGEVKAVLQDIHSYEQTQETLALLKILALGQQQLAEGKTGPLADGISRINARRKNCRMTFVVQLTVGAEVDLADIHESSGGTMAGCGQTNCSTVFKAFSTSSETFPERGEHPPELLALGIKLFPQVHHKRYRMTYQVTPCMVSVLLVLDGARDFKTLL